MKIRSILTLTTAIAGGLQFSAAALLPATASAQDFRLEEIIVTATRRETNLQSTPVAVSALDSSLIDQAAPRDLGDLAAFVPNFSASQITGFNAASFALRGVGQNNIIVYFEAPVAVLVDDFVLPSVQTQLLDTFDVEQVEVLRGPQGTLFGKNTTGGAVLVRTKRPDLDETSAEMRASYGSFNTYTAKAAVNVPLVENKLALRLVGGHENSDGYMRNGATYGPVVALGVTSKFEGVSGAGDGERVGGTNVWNVRAKLLAQPTDNVRALLQYEFLRDRSDSPATVNTTSPDNPSLLFNLLGLSGNPKGDPHKLGGVSNRQGLLLDVDKGHRIDVDGVYLNVDVDTSVGTITSVSGYRSQKSRLANTYTSTAPVADDGEVLSLFDANRSDDRKTYQQELRFASTFDGPFNFVAGAFYQNDKTDFCVAQVLGFQDLVAPPTPYGPWNQTPYLLCNNQRADSQALFTEGTWDVTDRLTLTGGIRYTWEKKVWRGRQQTFVQDLKGFSDPDFTWQQLGNLMDAADFSRFPDGVVTNSNKWKEPTWRVSLGYQATDDLYAYLTYSRGFKSGAYNDQIGSFAPFGNNMDAFRVAANPTDPEIADSFEGGLKFQGLDNRLRMNVTGFFVQYKDVQKQIVVPITVNGQPFQVTSFFNAAKMEVKGLEAEVTAAVAEGFTLRGLLGYQDGKYKEYVTPIPAGYDLATSPIDRAPKWQWTVDAHYELPVADWGRLSFNANVNYTGRNLFTQSITSLDENTYLNARTLVNAAVTLSDAEDNYYVRLLGRNLTDKEYITGSQVVGGLWSWALYGPPRSFELEIGARF